MNLDSFVGVHDESDEEGEDDVDEEGDEGVEVDARHPPDEQRALRHAGERGEHVVAVHQREQAFRRRRYRLKLFHSPHTCYNQKKN